MLAELLVLLLFKLCNFFLLNSPVFFVLVGKVTGLSNFLTERRDGSDVCGQAYDSECVHRVHASAGHLILRIFLPYGVSGRKFGRQVVIIELGIVINVLLLYCFH